MRIAQVTAALLIVAALGVLDPLHAASSPYRDQTYVTNAMIHAASSPGVESVSTMTVVESGMPPIHHSVFTLTATSVATADHTTSGGSGGLLLYTFPEGIINVNGCVTNLTTAEASSTITNTAALVHALGSVTDGGDDTLTSTEANIIASYAGSLTSSAGVFKSYSLASVRLDGHTTAAKMYLNVAMPDAASSGAGAVTYTGTITCDWYLAGDN